MSGFSVEVEALATAVAALRGSLTVVGDWERRGDQLAAASGSAGHERMSDAITQFCSEWNHGFSTLAGDVDELSNGLLIALETYVATDETIATAAGGD